MRLRSKVVHIWGMSCCVLLAVTPAWSQLSFLEATDSGTYRQDGYSSGPATNYLAGDTAAAGVNEIRNFFVFDLSGLSGTVSTAALQLYNPGDPPDLGDGFNSPDAFETYRLYEVSTDLATLSGGTGGVATFNDLGDGTIFGSVDIDAGDNATMIFIALNQDAVAAINAAAGGSWAISGAVTTLEGTPLQDVFAYSNGSMRRRLILDFGETVFWDDLETSTTERWASSMP